MAAKMLVEKNNYLLFIMDEENYSPLHRAVINSHKETFLYLLHACKHHISLSQQDGYHNPFEGKHGASLLVYSIRTGYLEVAYELMKDYPDLARTKSDGYAPLENIAERWDAYRSGKRYNFYERFIYSNVPTKNNDLRDEHKIQDIEKFDAKGNRSCFHSVIRRVYVGLWKSAILHVSHIKQLYEDKVEHNTASMVLKCICNEVGKLNKGSEIFEHYSRGFNQAVKNDTVEAIEEIFECFPQSIWTLNSGYDLAQVAVLNRCENVYNFLVHKVAVAQHGYLHKISVDAQKNSILHLAGQLAPIHKLNMVSGAALQMQRELQWFQAVEKFMSPKDKEERNIYDETPMMMFRREHTGLRKDGEEWMKKTADSCTISAALIITIVFAAAITVPGGTNSDTGKAVYVSKPSFIVFAIADAISLFTSTTSLLLFLSILTARYRDEDFLYSLPKRLILGLTMLFLSVTSMMVAFSATLYIMFGQGNEWIVIPIATLTCLPIASFVTLQLPLLVDLIYSTYGKGIFAKPIRYMAK